MALKKPEAMQALDAVKLSCKHCENAARMRVKTAEGWENVCDEHYVEHFRHEADRGCESIGLVRRPDESPMNYRLRVSAWIKDKATRLVKRMPK